MNLFLLFATIIIGIAITFIAAKKPQLMWPILIGVLVFSGGLMISGYPVIADSVTLCDEYFIFFLIFGAILAFLGGTQIKKENSDVLRTIHNYLFSVFIVYMFFESLRGYFIWSNLNAIRWTGLYALLGLMFLVMSYKPFSIFNRRYALIAIILSALSYFVFYLSHGIYSGLFRDINWSYLQGKEWTGGAYANFPAVLAILSAIIIFREKTFDLRWRFFALLLLTICLFSGLYYESRILLLVFSIFLLLFALKAGIKMIAPVVLIFIIFLTGYFLLTGGITQNIRNYSNIFRGTLEGKHDSDRIMHLKASLNSVDGNWKTFLFGYGIYSYHFVLVPYLQEISDANRRDVKVEGPVITESFMAFLTDTGWIGILLLISNIICTGIAVFYKRNSNTIFIMFALLFLFFWIFITNLNDFVLFYVMIMPGGLLFNLNKTSG